MSVSRSKSVGTLPANSTNSHHFFYVSPIRKQLSTSTVYGVANYSRSATSAGIIPSSFDGVLDLNGKMSSHSEDNKESPETVVEELIKDHFSLEDDDTKTEDKVIEDHKEEGQGDTDDNESEEKSDQPKDDFVDEEQLKKEEEGLTGEQLAERLDKAKDFKEAGNSEYAQELYRESILSYTKALLICPLKETDLRAVCYSNRAAAKVKLELKDGAIEDCTASLEHNPKYMKPLVRRAKLYEDTQKLDEALADYQKIVELDPSNREAHYAVQRLPSQINERNEKLKAEMLGKLKELGNMVLRPFGFSTDNFQIQQDPNSGSYSVNFKK